MNILTLFNGIGGLPLSCERADIKVDKCYYSEIDKFANKVMEHHYPDAIALGDVTKWREWDIDWSSIDLVGAGFPCQSWSLAGQQLGDKDERGMLFWTTLEIIKHVLYFNPSAKFLMENVKMKKEFEEYITHHTTQALGYVEKTLINSALVSAQNRNRYYWTNFPVTQPDDKGILLKDILEDIDVALTDGELKYMNGLRDGKPRIETRSKNPETDEKYFTVTSNFCKGVPYGVIGIMKVCNVNPSGNGMNGNVYHTDGKSPTLTTNKGEGVKITGYRPCERINEKTEGHIANATDIKGMDCIKRVYHPNGKAPTLTTMGGGHREPKVAVSDITYRKLTPTECARLQTFPDGWCESVVSKTQSYKAYGNSWTIDVIAHILKGL